MGCVLTPGPIFAQEYPKLSPYPAIRWNPEVQIDGKWLILRSIDGLTVEEIIAFAAREHESRWQKRFEEDLVQVLSEMGRVPGNSVTLVVRDPEVGKEQVLTDVALTAENRQAVMAKKPTSPLAQVSPAALQRALDDFQVAIDERWSYRHANDADFHAAIEALRKQVDAGISPGRFGRELQKIISLGIDGHAAVAGYEAPRGGYLPFLIEPVGERLVAFKPDRSGFLIDGFPILTRIDGKPITQWRQTAAALVPKGSPQYVLRHSLRELRNLDYLREATAIPKMNSVEIELTDEEGTIRKLLTLPVASELPTYGVWPRGGSRLLDGNIGYLRMGEMDEFAVQEIRTWMPRFRGAKGLVVDVRDNGGGSRDSLLQLYSYLAAPGGPPRVVTAAAYRLHKEHRDDHLAQRYMFRAESLEWNDRERQAISEFALRFRPAWKLPPGQFSDWHYLVLSPLDDPEIYHFDRPVAVLMNAKCFSATDVFLAGLKGIPNVNLVGTPSGGGSALAQKVTLGGLPFELRIGSIASFQADGRLFDGNGVQPDRVIEPEPAYFIGGPDNVLDSAVQMILDSCIR
jgi:hypothetical protein